MIELAEIYEPKPKSQLGPKVTVMGIGGAGCNAIDNMIQANLAGANFVVANTDAQALTHSLCDQKIQLGPSVTKGLGAGSQPAIGLAAAEESLNEITKAISGSDMLFVAAGMGGGTGTGAAPLVAKAAREKDILTVGVVTKPFEFEGLHRLHQAEEGIKELTPLLDALIVIPNQNLSCVADENIRFSDAFKLADSVLRSGVRSITDVIFLPGLVNIDFADVQFVMSRMGRAVMGVGEVEGENRAYRAAEMAISNPLLEDNSISGACNLLINITGGADLSLSEVTEAADRVRAEVNQKANIIFGSAYDETLKGKIRVSVISTGTRCKKDTSSTELELSSADNNHSSESAVPGILGVQQEQIVRTEISRLFDALSCNKEEHGCGAKEKTIYVVYNYSGNVKICKCPANKLKLLQNSNYNNTFRFYDSLGKAKSAALKLSEQLRDNTDIQGASNQNEHSNGTDFLLLAEHSVPNFSSNLTN